MKGRTFVLIAFGSFLTYVAIAWIIISATGCGGNVARVAEPAAVYDEVTVEEYAAAEASFAGSEDKSAAFPPPPPPRDSGVYWNDERCQELLNKRDAISNTLLGLGVLTGGSGLTTVIPKDMEKEKKENLQVTFGSLTLAFGVADAILVGVVKTLSTRYEQNCRTERPEPPEHPASDEVDLAPMPEEFEVDGGVD